MKHTHVLPASVLLVVAHVMLALAAPAAAEVLDGQRRTGAFFPTNPRTTSTGYGSFPRNPCRTTPRPRNFAEAANKAPVTLFITNCGDPCTQAAALLQGRGVPYSTRQIDKDPDAAKALRQLIGQLQVPVLKIGDNVQKGFEKVLWNNLLETGRLPARQRSGGRQERPRQQGQGGELAGWLSNASSNSPKRCVPSAGNATGTSFTAPRT